MQETNEKMFVQYDQEGDKVINSGTLTKEEQQYFNKARQQHRKNMIKQQRVGNKVFKGSAFIAKPDKILFKDFTVGKTHIQIITLTNVSNAFNSFNVLPLPQKVRNYFEVEYIPKGKISPGISCEIKFKFLPQLNQDIQSEFSILAQTGKISYPLICTSKKTVVKCLESVVNFGKIIYGEVGNAKLNLINHGTLPSQLIWHSSRGQQLQKIQSQQQKEFLSQLTIQKHSNIQGNCEKTLSFEFRPNKIGPFRVELQLYIKNFLHSPPINIEFVGHCVQVPVKIEKPIYNFQICLLSHIYRQKLVFYNRGQTSMSFKMMQPNQTKKYFEFNPVIGYIQKQSKIEVWIKFSAEKNLPIYLSKYIVEPNVYEVPFYMSVKQQFLPVQFKVRFKIISEKLNITPTQLNFGTIFQGLSSKIQVTFQNQSQLPQQIMFYPLKKNIFVENDQPILKILPKQTIKTFINYSSKILDDNGKPFRQEGSIPCKIITGQIAVNQIKLDYSCQTIRPDLSIPKNKIDLPAIQIDQTCSASTIIKNNSNKEIIYQIFVPHQKICGLRLTPVVKLLPPKSSVQVNIEYLSSFRKLGPFTMDEILDSSKPQQNSSQQPQKIAPQPTKKDNKKQPKLTKQQIQQMQLQQKMKQQAQKERKAKLEEQRKLKQRDFDMQKELSKIGGKFFDFGNAQHYKWLLPVYFKQKQYPDASSQINFIQITTTAIEKVLTVDHEKIDFGEIAVGARQVRQVRIYNLGQTLKLQKKQLPVFCCFSVLNNMKQIQHNGYFKAVIEFQPIQQQKFEQRLVFFTEKSRVSCLLTGKGVRPQVKIDPADGLLNVGSVLHGQYTQRSFKIENSCNFQVQFNLQIMGMGIKNWSGQRAISYIPSNGIISGNSFCEVKVKFRPDRISEKFFEKIKISVPQQKNEKFLYVWGSCYPRQAYVLQHINRVMPQTSSLVKTLQSPFDSFSIRDEDTIYGINSKKILLEFPKITDPKDQESCKRKIVIGSCKLLDPKLEKPTNFQIIMPKQDKLQCDNLKGAVTAGTQTIVTFTYKPQQIDPFMAKIAVLAGVGQWKDFKCELKLSGGFTKPGAQDAVSLQITLRAYINQL